MGYTVERGIMLISASLTPSLHASQGVETTEALRGGEAVTVHQGGRLSSGRSGVVAEQQLTGPAGSRGARWAHEPAPASGFQGLDAPGTRG